MSEIYHIGINDIEPHHWVAWVFDWHGCFAKGTTRDETIDFIPEAIWKYFAWRKRHDRNFQPPRTDMTVSIDEELPSHTIDDYIVNALFAHDKLPLTRADIDEIGKILSFSRHDLLSLLSSISPIFINKSLAGEVTGSIAGVVRHIATAEMWYFDRIGLTVPREKRPEEFMTLFSVSREHTLDNLHSLEGQIEIYEKHSELWTARKVLRRALWHEIAHTKQIARYIAQNKQAADR